MAYDRTLNTIRHIIEQFAFSKVKSFYPETILKFVDKPLDEIVPRLNELCKEDILQLKFEIRCPQDAYTVKIVDKIEPLINNYFECDKCGHEFKLDLNYVYPKYYISNEYKEDIQLKKNKIYSMMY